MTDDPTSRPPRRPARPEGAALRPAGPPADPTRPAGPPAGSAGVPSQDDPMAALERLQSLGTEPAGAPADHSGRPAPPSHDRRPNPRPAGGAAADLTVARLAAPAVFLVAVIVLISLLFQSGVVGGQDEARVTKPKPAVTKTKKATPKPATAASTTKVYVVRAGDTPSGIAEKYGLSMSELEALNPDMDFTTLVVGEKVKVPRQ